MEPSDLAAISDRFGAVVDAVTDWDAPTPVPEWRARDIVHHLTTWLPGLLGSCGVQLPAGDISDPVGSWQRQDAAVRQLLAERGGEQVTHSMLGTASIAELLARVYQGDVFMHTWDLARSAGVPDRLDPATCEDMSAGMRGMEDVLRGSGHFGPAWSGEVPADADAAARLMAFVGRDPDWRRVADRRGD